MRVREKLVAKWEVVHFSRPRAAAGPGRPNRPLPSLFVRLRASFFPNLLLLLVLLLQRRSRPRGPGNRMVQGPSPPQLTRVGPDPQSCTFQDYPAAEVKKIGVHPMQGLQNEGKQEILTNIAFKASNLRYFAKWLLQMFCSFSLLC